MPNCRDPLKQVLSAEDVFRNTRTQSQEVFPCSQAPLTFLGEVKYKTRAPTPPTGQRSGTPWTSSGGPSRGAGTTV